MANGDEVELLTHIATTLQGMRTVRFTYKASAVYSSGDGFGIHMMLDADSDLPTCTITEYPVSEDVVGGDRVVGIQFRLASKDRRAVLDAVHDLRTLFHARWGGNLGSIKLIQSVRSSGANLGQDANGRLVRTENYYLTINRP